MYRAGTQDVWCAFLIYLCFSRFATVKLGQADEKPKYNDFAWFAMLFTCGVAVGLYVFGVGEPLYFYRQPTLWSSWEYDYTITKTAVTNDAQRAQQAIFQTVYHWGIHGWVRSSLSCPLSCPRLWKGRQSGAFVFVRVRVCPCSTSRARSYCLSPTLPTPTIALARTLNIAWRHEHRA